MTKAADDYESIARHLKELEAERQLALTGSSAPVTEPKPASHEGFGEYALGYSSPGLAQSGFVPPLPCGWPYGEAASPFAISTMTTAELRSHAYTMSAKLDAALKEFLD